jgi:hypothetical protein
MPFCVTFAFQLPALLNIILCNLSEISCLFAA